MTSAALDSPVDVLTFEDYAMKPPDQLDLTQLVQAAASGDRVSEGHLCNYVYDELHKLAEQLLWDKEATSLQPTILVHELLSRVFKIRALRSACNRRYFFAVALDQMRKMLVDHQRKRRTIKHGGKMKRVLLDEALDQEIASLESQNELSLEALDIALESLKRTSPRQHEVIMHRFFGGATIEETAEVLDVSIGTVERDWRLARAKLHAMLND